MDAILIKLSGELFSKDPSPNGEGFFIKKIIPQIKELKNKYKIGFVIGGGNIFRGSLQGKTLGLSQTSAHVAGMVATITNGIILQDMLQQENIPVTLFSAIHTPQVTQSIRPDKINTALQDNNCLIFVGGTGNPFFTTDTNAVLRALQINATQVWKCTKVDGIYTDDPMQNKDSKLIKEITYQEVMEKGLKVMDLTAITLAKENNIKIKVFNLFENNSIIKAVKEKNCGSLITKE